MSLLVVALLLAADGEPEDSGHGYVAVTGSALLPIERSGLPATVALEAGFERIPQMRWLFAGTFFARLPGGGARLMSGVEAIISPLLPLEVSVGALIGFGYGFFGDVGLPLLTAQLRGTVGYRVTRWFIMSALVSGNYVWPTHHLWLEAGARLAFRW